MLKKEQLLFYSNRSKVRKIYKPLLNKNNKFLESLADYLYNNFVKKALTMLYVLKRLKKFNLLLYLFNLYKDYFIAFIQIKLLSYKKLLLIKNSNIKIIKKNKIYCKEKIVVKNNVLNEKYSEFKKDYFSSEIYLTKIKDCFFYTNIDLIFHSKTNYIYNDNNITKDFILPEEYDKLSITTILSPRKLNKLYDPTKGINLNNIFYINSRLVLNYSHWLLEFLPKIVIFYSDKKNLDIPMTINSDIHKNCLQQILLFNRKIKIILVKPYLKINAKTIHHITPVSDIPFNYRTEKSFLKNLFSFNKFSKKPYKILRNLFIKKKELLKYKQKYLGAKVYLSRKAKYRLIKNEIEIININAKKGYLIKDPVKLLMEEQIALFYYSKIIVTASGSSMANLIFSGKSLKLVYLASDCKKHGYHFYPRLANVANPDLKILQFLGNKTNSVHESYSIDTIKYINFLNENDL